MAKIILHRSSETNKKRPPSLRRRGPTLDLHWRLYFVCSKIPCLAQERKMKFRVAVDDFLHFCRVERQLSSHTIQAYDADLTDFLKWLSPEMTVPETTASSLKEYFEYLICVRKLTVATVRRRFACLRAFFRRTAALNSFSDPCSVWRPVFPRRKRLPRTLSRIEASNLLHSSRSILITKRRKDLAFGAIVRLLVVTGMRVGELCKLALDDFSSDCSTCRIQGKGSRDRIAYITDAPLREELFAILESRKLANGTVRAMFLNRYGAPMTPQSVRSKLRRVAQAAGLSRRITPHMLRHTAATLLLEKGVDIRFVQRLLGHSSIATTEIYTHVSDEALRATLARADVLTVLAHD
jgi:integrase/recombinase XerD